MGSGSRGAGRLSLEGIVAGVVSMDWRARHELKMFPKVLLCALVGGLAGGDAKRAD